MRQIVLDTETTGLEVSQDHRIIEIGCVELVDRRLTGRHYHQYINPEREVDEGAFEVHGLSTEFLEDKPVFSKIVDEFLEFISGAELVIHNAPFDIAFINHELAKLNSFDPVEKYCSVIDTLLMARQKHPGQKNNLDALCKRYFVDNSQRDLHGALLDAEILADVYLLMTGGQVDMMLGGQQAQGAENIGSDIRRLSTARAPLKVIRASHDELKAHEEKLQSIQERSDGRCLWLAESE